MSNIRYIDLEKYGGVGQITICGDRCLRNEVIIKNEMSRRLVKVKVTEDGGTDAQYEDRIDAGDMEIIQVLRWVRKAPFSPTFDSFMKYCDKLEESRPGASMELFEEMQNAAQEVISEPTPLEN